MISTKYDYVYTHLGKSGEILRVFSVSRLRVHNVEGKFQSKLKDFIFEFYSLKIFHFIVSFYLHSVGHISGLQYMDINVYL